jgi:hypothetical protein
LYDFATAFSTNVWCSESDLEAEKTRGTLQNLVEQLLESNQDISSRLRNLEDTCESQSTVTRCFRNGSNTELAEKDGGQAVAITPGRLVSDDSNYGRINFPVNAFRFTFENDLETSRVYNRTQIYEPDVSFTSSAVRTHAWSIFSGLSLAEVSIISAVALPLYSHEISNSQWYNFGESGQAGPQRGTPVKEAPSILSTARYTVNESAGAENTSCIMPRTRSNCLDTNNMSRSSLNAQLGPSLPHPEPVAQENEAVNGSWPQKTLLTCGKETISMYSYLTY